MTRVGFAVHRTFHAVSHSRNFRLFFLGQAVSVTGTWMQSVALAWLVLQLSHSGVALGVQAALNFGPVLVLGAWGGLLADRHDKRAILVGTQTAFAILAFSLWALVAAGMATLWIVYVLTLLQGIVTAIDNPARQSFFAEMVRDDDLTNAVSLNSAVMTGTRIVGPALAGVLIATVGLAACFLFNGISYLAVIAALLAMRADELRRTNGARGGKHQLREGFAYAWNTDELRRPLVWMAIVFMFSFNYAVLFPLLAERTFEGGPGTFGVLLSVMGVGSLVAALVMARQRHPTPMRLAAAAAGFGAVTLLAAAAPTLGTELAVLLPLGFVSMVFMITGNSTLQLTSRPEMRGRVMALYGIVFLGGTPIGGPISGWVGQTFGPRMGIALGGVVAMATGLVGMWILTRTGHGARDRSPVLADARGSLSA